MGGRLNLLWSARSVAVVGASSRPGALGRLPVEYLLRYGYRGRVLPINPRAGEICGLPAYPSVAAAPGPVELALIVVPADRVPAAVDDCAAAGVPVAIVGSAGFAETGPDGLARQRDLVARARSAGMRLVGPNCIGAVGLRDGLVASFSPLFGGEHTRLVPGGVGFVSQSGALGYGAVSLALERGLGLGWAVTTGNEADVTALEALCALAAEPSCTALLGYLESLSGPAGAFGLRELAASGKPVALLVAGRSAAGARAAASHTGTLASPDRVISAALRQYGIAEVSDVDELLDVGDAFAQPLRPAGPRVAVLTTSGGSGILAADAIDRYGLVLAELQQSTMDHLAEIVPPYGSTRNPVDVTATVMSDRTLVHRATRVVTADPGVDLLIVCCCVLTGSDVDAIVSALSGVVRDHGKPVLAVRTGADQLAPTAAAALRAAGVPGYLTPLRAVRAAAALCRVSRPARATRPAPATPDRSTGTAGRPASPRPVPGPDATEPELKSLLAAAGIAVPRGRVVASAAEAEAAVRELAGPAVLKLVARGVLHKSELGGVLLGVTPAEAATAYARLAALAGAHAAPAGPRRATRESRPAAVLVEERLPAGVELLVGVAPHPLGRVLTIGAGGTLTELLDDAAVRLLPVDGTGVRRQLAETRAGRLLAGHRGARPSDVDAFVELVLAVTELVADWPPGYTLDLNPVLVREHGAVVLDAALLDAPVPEGT